MKTAAIPFHEDPQAAIALLGSKLQERDQEIAQNKVIIHTLEQQLAWFKRQMFGKRAERTVAVLSSQQLEFEGFENLAKEAGKKKPIAAHERRSPKRDGKEAIKLPPDLPVKTIVLDVPEDEKICKETGKPLVKIGEEVSLRLAHEPGSYYIKEIIRPKYAYPEKPENGILAAALPDSIIPRCRADESLLAEIITAKFADHIPLCRKTEEMGRCNISISRKLLSDWVVRCGLALKPLHEVMKQMILGEENIYVDESPVKLQAPGQCKIGYVWVMVGGKGSNPAYRIYDFRDNRRHENVPDILKGYGGILHSDKYGAYQRLAEQKIITWCPCFSHIRRKFFEAEGSDSFCDWVLRKIRYLFMYERVAWARPPDERLKIRQEKEIPIIDELIEKVKEKLHHGKVLPKSKLREALYYFYSLVPYLKNYTKHPFSRLDNNVAERAIRPLAIGRKNWLFFGSTDGGEAGTILLSLVQTCRGLRINPREYLEDILRRFMSHSANRLEELLPDQWLAARQAANQNRP